MRRPYLLATVTLVWMLSPTARAGVCGPLALARAAAPDHIVQIKNKRNQKQELQVENSDISGSTVKDSTAGRVSFQNVVMPDASFSGAYLLGLRLEDVNLSRAHIHNANLSDLELGGAQLGGALFRHIGLPPKGAPNYVEGATQRPLRFEECDLNGSTFQGCDLSGVAIRDSKLSGMTIDGVPIEEMIKAYREKHGAPR